MHDSRNKSQANPIYSRSSISKSENRIANILLVENRFSSTGQACESLEVRLSPHSSCSCIKKKKKRNTDTFRLQLALRILLFTISSDHYAA